MTEREGLRTTVDLLSNLNNLAGSREESLNWYLADEVLNFSLVITESDQALTSNDSPEIEAD